MESELTKYEAAGKITAQVRKYAESLVREDALLLDIARAVEKKIVELGGRPAFPVNISINEIAAHYTPKYNDATVLKKGDLAKVDFGVHVGGCPTDIAFTVSIGEDEENERLIAASKVALDAALSAVKPNAKVSEVGAKIDSAAKKFGLQVIRNLSGHGLKKFDLHAEPSIPNFDNKESTPLEENSIVAIEPFVTSGKGFVTGIEACEVYKVIRPVPIRDKEILAFINKEFGTFPFAKRWLTEKFGVMRAGLALRELVSRGALHEYKILKEASGAKVAQAEHSILVSKVPKVLTAD